MKLNYEEVRNGLLSKTDAQLIDILAFTQDDYQPEVIPIIEDILISRGISKTDINGYKSSYDKFKNRIYKQDFIPKYKTPIIVSVIVLATGAFVYRTSVVNYFKANNSIQETGWSVGYTDSIKNVLVNSSGFKSIPEKYKKPFCDCYIDTLKKLYPNRLKSTLTVDIVDSLISKCADKVKAEH